MRKPPLSVTISAWSRETSLPASRRSLVSRRPIPNASLTIGTMRRPSASVTSRRASGIGGSLSNADCRLRIADSRNGDCRLAPADDADDEEDDDGADGEADAETVAAARRQHALAGGAEIEPEQDQQDQRDQRGEGTGARPDGRRLAHGIGRGRAAAITDDRLVGDLGAAVPTNHRSR